LRHLDVSECLKKLLLASVSSEKHRKKDFKNFENFEIFFLCYFSKNKNFHGYLPGAGRFRELDHKQ
jgi:hypothetical protein